MAAKVLIHPDQPDVVPVKLGQLDESKFSYTNSTILELRKHVFTWQTSTGLVKDLWQGELKKMGGGVQTDEKAHGKHVVMRHFVKNKDAISLWVGQWEDNENIFTII